MAGYIGEAQAAPVLLEMLKREEGLWGGYYTGLATLHEGRLHYRKIVGDLTALIKSTDAAHLPGTVGIIHSRTPGGGGQEWAHPFTGQAEQLAYIANGAPGQFTSHTDLAAAGYELLKAGHQFKSADTFQSGKHPRLADDSTVHISDVMCQKIADNLQNQGEGDSDLLAAAMEAYQSLPGELAGLCLHATRPDEIVAVRYNKPLEIGRDDRGGVYIASSALAFPDGVSWSFRMPAQSGAAIHRNGEITIKPLAKTTTSVGAFPSVTAIQDRLGHRLAQGPATIGQLRDAVAPLWPEGTLSETEIAVYENLVAWHREGLVCLEDKRVPGMEGAAPGVTAPQTWVYWKG